MNESERSYIKVIAWGAFAGIIIYLLLLATGAVEAQQTFDPGHNDISIQPIGTSITRCQFSDNQAGQMIKGYKVPDFVRDPKVSFEQYRMGSDKNGPVCQVPMLRGNRANSAGVNMPFTCFFEMNCSS